MCFVSHKLDRAVIMPTEVHLTQPGLIIQDKKLVHEITLRASSNLGCSDIGGFNIISYMLITDVGG